MAEGLSTGDQNFINRALCGSPGLQHQPEGNERAIAARTSAAKYKTTSRPRSQQINRTEDPSPSVQAKDQAGHQNQFPTVEQSRPMLTEPTYVDTSVKTVLLGQGDRETQEENNDFRVRVAAVNGLTPGEVDETELKEFFWSEFFNRQGKPTELTPVYDKYVGASRDSREGQERRQEVGQLAEAILEYPSYLYSYGLFAPDYSAALSVHEDLNQDPERDPRAYLVGALTRSTVKEFVSTVKLAQPKANCFVTDIEGESTPHADPSAHFMYGNACELGVADGSMDTIHTNILLKKLKGSPAKFFLETHRALSDTGLLVMVEPTEDTVSTVVQLEKAGFTDISVQPALKFASRRSMEKILTFGKFQDPAMQDVGRSNHERVIIASKLPKGTYKEALKRVKQQKRQ